MYYIKDYSVFLQWLTLVLCKLKGQLHDVDLGSQVAVVADVVPMCQNAVTELEFIKILFCMSVWMNKWNNDWIYEMEWMNEWMNKWTNEWMKWNEWVNEWMNEWNGNNECDGSSDRSFMGWTHWAISRSSQCSTTGITKAVVCIILSVGWCI